MLKIVSIFLLFTCINIVFCETCTKYDFENSFESLFSNNSLTCQSFSSWQIGNYSDTLIQRPNLQSNKFISPVKIVSENEWQLLNNCIRSFGFPMGAGGTVEVMFYIEATSQRDLLYITASKIVPGGNEVDVGFARYSMTNSDYRHGWNILKIDIGGSDAQFDGYIYFFGTVTEGATILVDSFRYIGPNGENENCELELITEYPTTIVDSDVAIDEEHCTTYDFETNYETLFTNETILCSGSLSWELQSYTSINIESPHIQSSSFITPAYIVTDAAWQTFSSCVTSFTFPMVEAGSLEVNLYMEANSPIDILYVDVIQITVDGSHVSIATEMYSKIHTDYKAGWNILKINVQSSVERFDGYISILGVLSKGSTLLIDSFRYVSSTINEESCVIYTDVETSTITTTDDPTTTEYPTTTNETTTTDNPTTTDEPITTENPTTTDDPTTTDNPTTTDEPTTTNNPTTTDEPPTTDNPTTTDEPTTTENPTTTDDPTTTDSPASTDDPTTTDKLTTTNNPTTTDESTTTDNPTTTKPTSNAPVNEGKCVTYDFENYFDSKFTNDSLFCKGFPSWKLDRYTDINVVSPHIQSNYFIKPTIVLSENAWQTISSCVTSFTFLMEVSGIIEVKFYMEAKAQSDNLLVAASRTDSNGFDVIINLANYSPIDADYKDGWNTLTIKITDVADEFEGHLLFLGTVSENAVLIVDSFRYIGPMIDEESCVVYTDAETTTSIPTTDNPTTTTDNPNTITDNPITTTSPVEEDLCVTYDYEENFDNLFTHDNYLCVGFTTWHLGNYSSIEMNGFDPSSNLFMSPNKDLSCIASFPFSMSPGGTVEVNVFMETVSDLDHITVLAKMLVSNGVDTVAGMNMYNPSSAAFVRGWNVLQIRLASLTDFNGYLLFLGAAADGATVLVDSFRYIPPTVSADHESCAIY